MISTDCDDMMAVDRRGRDTATVVIAVGVGTINLALGKPATQSSTFLYHSINTTDPHDSITVV
jgi:hypothetical protein